MIYSLLNKKVAEEDPMSKKDQLLINRMIIKDWKSKQRNMGMAWIDYREAFDSVAHKWILKVLDLFKISPIWIRFLRINMSMWETTLNLTHQNDNLKWKPIKIYSGIFQIDSLFCVPLILLSKKLNRTGYGYST